jgi:hypothetical protein
MFLYIIHIVRSYRLNLFSLHSPNNQSEPLNKIFIYKFTRIPNIIIFKKKIVRKLFFDG